MGKEGAVENAPEKMEKRNKLKSKKREKNEESSMGIDEAQSISTVKEIEHMRRSEKEDIAEMKRHRKRDKDRRKNMGIKDTEEVAIEKKGAKESKGVHGKDVHEDATDNTERKRKKREKKNKIEGNESKVFLEKENKIEEESVSGVKSDKEAKKEKKKQKSMRKLKAGDIETVGEKEDGKEVGAQSENSEVNVSEMVERKKRKREKKRTKDESEKMFETLNEAHNEDFAEKTERKKKKKRTVEENDEGNVQSNEYDENFKEKLERKNKKEKKYKNNENYKNDSSATQQDISMQDSGDNESNGLECPEKGKKKKKTKLVDNDLINPTPNKSNKKVRFSGEDEVFPLPGDSDNVDWNYDEEDGLLRGKRFTPEEDEILKEAVLKYIAENDLGEEGLNMVLNSKKHYKLKGCWKEIGSAIPYRPYTASYCRAQVLFRRSEHRGWTQEEYDQIIKYQEEHGNQWRPLADELGKHRWHVKDTWRRIKLKDMKRGHWSQSEYQQLFDLVNSDLKMKVSEQKKSKHGMLRDNISWGAISDQLSTRTNATCCVKWYTQLTSRMVAEGAWADTDDYRLLGALYNLDATCIEDVEWDDLLDDRSGDLCRKRWGQMVLHLGHHGSKSFSEQVEVMAKRYCPDLLEVREAWDSKPRVP
ncbi:hypothetical protein BUALT_Bualt02G0140800 [Buddleja alternifolia]|uniref:Myb-like domain-containing protein n=1 Tax=Buddleja alternifolia TaxID=168488 RepID=A0AAV6YAX0_9LAMI|nr:hypothetical protein BUALT_Bualt02G0140800 [Buddleja alternifolia]